MPLLKYKLEKQQDCEILSMDLGHVKNIERNGLITTQ